MKINLGEAVIYVKADRKQFEFSLNKAHSNVKKSVVLIQKRFNSLNLRRAALAVTAFAAATVASLVMIGKKFISAADQAEQYRVRLEVLLGSTQEGALMFKEMAEYAGRVPFQFEEIMSGATSLAGVMKGGVAEVKKWIPLIGDLAATTGMSIQETIGQVIRMYSAGAASADMFRERGILAMLGFQAGVRYTAEETRKMMFQAWEKMDSQFRGATEKLADTWKGLTSMLADAWFVFKTRVMEAGVMDFLKEQLRGVISKIEDLKASGKFDEFARDISKNVIEKLKMIKEILKSIVEKTKILAQHKDLIGKIFVVSIIAIVTAKLWGLIAAIAALNIAIVTTPAGQIIFSAFAVGGAIYMGVEKIRDHLDHINSLKFDSVKILTEKVSPGGIPMQMQNIEMLKNTISDLAREGKSFNTIWQDFKENFTDTKTIEVYGTTMQHMVQIMDAAYNAAKRKMPKPAAPLAPPTYFRGGIRPFEKVTTPSLGGIAFDPMITTNLMIASGAAQSRLALLDVSIGVDHFRDVSMKATREMSAGWYSLSNQISNVLANSVMEAGNAFENIMNSFKRMLTIMAAELAAKAVIFNVLGAFNVAGFAKGGFWKFAFPGFASGGLVTKPTLALVGERGPERILSPQETREYNNDNSTINMYFGSDDISEMKLMSDYELAERIKKAVRDGHEIQ